MADKRSKAHWDAIATKIFCERETGLGWNHEKGTIDATPKRWVALKAENKDYGKFEHHGLENRTTMEIMFASIVATGETAWTPAASPFLPEQQHVGVENAVDLEEGSGDSDEPIHLSTQTGIGGSSEKRKKNRIESSSTGRGKKVKSGGAALMHRQLTHLCDVVESYASASLSESSKKNYETSAASIRECMELLLTLPGVKDGDEFFMLGTRLFVKQENREMFMSIKSATSKIAWLNQELGREKK
ncbi:hypothetical protein SLA2020_126880 [Shorea laevis]